MVPWAVPEGVATIRPQRNSTIVFEDTIDVTPVAPSILSTWVHANPQAQAWNEDGTQNSASNAALIGSRITILATGLGRMDAELPDGSVGQPGNSPRARIEVEQLDSRDRQPVIERVEGSVQGVLWVQFVAQPLPGALIRPAAVPVRVYADGVPSPPVLVWIK